MTNLLGRLGHLPTFTACLTLPVLRYIEDTARRRVRRARTCVVCCVLCVPLRPPWGLATAPSRGSAETACSQGQPSAAVAVWFATGTNKICEQMPSRHDGAASSGAARLKQHCKAQAALHRSSSTAKLKQHRKAQAELQSSSRTAKLEQHRKAQAAPRAGRGGRSALGTAAAAASASSAGSASPSPPAPSAAASAATGASAGA